MIDIYIQDMDDDELLELAKKYDDAEEDEKALPILENLARKGHAMAQEYLGVYYEYGCAGLEVNIEKAFDLYLKSAEQGCADAMCDLGNLYEEGLLPEGQNLEKAVVWYEKAKELGLPDAFIAIGRLYRDGQGYEKDLQKAYDCFCEAMERSNEEDQKGLAAFYIGCILDSTAQYDEAFGYLTTAYDFGVEAAANLLGDAYHYGQGTEKNFSRAKCLYEEAVENGDADAMESLGRMYWEGDGCEKNWRKAFELFSKAADLGNEDALEALSYFYDEGGELENEDELRKCLLILEKSEDDFLKNQGKMRLEKLNQNKK